MPRGVYDRKGRHPHNWKGGRTIDPRGYVLIYQPDHRLADVRGYVYEHRLVAEEMLGRPLRAGEEVHHGPGGPSDNQPENLTVCGARWDHRQHHSTRPGRTRAPGETNPLVACACSCGALFTTYDGSGRPRRYVSGHNLRDGMSVSEGR